MDVTPGKSCHSNLHLWSCTQESLVPCSVLVLGLLTTYRWRRAWVCQPLLSPQLENLSWSSGHTHIDGLSVVRVRPYQGAFTPNGHQPGPPLPTSPGTFSWPAPNKSSPPLSEIPEITCPFTCPQLYSGSNGYSSGYGAILSTLCPLGPCLSLQLSHCSVVVLLVLLSSWATV